MLRSTFSTTTMASSTTMPIASTSPNSDRLLSVKPNIAMKKKVPTSDTGMATSGMTAARQVCRNRITTSTTRMIGLADGLDDGVDRLLDELGRIVDDRVLEPRRKALGELVHRRPDRPWRSASAFEPGRWKIAERDRGIAIEIGVGRVVERRKLDLARRPSGAPRQSAVCLTTMLANSLGSASRPSVCTATWKARGLVDRRLVEHARGHLHVLRLQCGDDIARS